MQFVPLALMAAGSLIKGYAGMQAGKANKKIAYANAQATLEDGNAQAIRIRNLARIQMGRQIGAQAESGFEVGTGSALDSLLESQTSAELDAMDALRQAETRAVAYRSSGDQAKREGNMAMLEGVVGAAASVGTGMKDYAQAKKGGG